MPSLYRHIEPFFPPNSFRTDEPGRQQNEIRDASRAEAMRLDRHRRVVIRDEKTDDLGRVEPCGMGMSKQNPLADSDADGYQRRVTVYDAAIINSVQYRCVLRRDRSGQTAR